MAVSAALRIETEKKFSNSEVEEKLEGGMEIWEREEKVPQSALSKHQRGGLGRGMYVLGDSKIGKWSLYRKLSKTVRVNSSRSEGEHSVRSRQEKDCVLTSKCVGRSVLRRTKSVVLERKDSRERPRGLIVESPQSV